MDHDDDRKTENEYENDEHFKVGIWNVKVNQISNVYYHISRMETSKVLTGKYHLLDMNVVGLVRECMYRVSGFHFWLFEGS